MRPKHIVFLNSIDLSRSYQLQGRIVCWCSHFPHSLGAPFEDYKGVEKELRYFCPYCDNVEVTNKVKKINRRLQRLAEQFEKLIMPKEIRKNFREE